MFDQKDMIEGTSRVLIGYNQILTALQVAEHNQFSLSLFEDFNRLVEAVVLYDKVVFLGDYEFPHSGFLSTLQQSGVFDFITYDKAIELIDSSESAQIEFERSMQHVYGSHSLERGDLSAYNLIALRYPPSEYGKLFTETYYEQVIAHHRSGGFDVEGFKSWNSRLAAPSQTLDTNIHYFARSLVYGAIANSQGMDYSPDMLRTPLAALALNSQSRFLSKQIYDAMLDEFKGETQQLMAIGMPSQVFIPPLTATILAKHPGPDNYADEILEMRRRFDKYRETYREFNALIADPNVTIKEKLQAKQRLDDSIKSIIAQGASGHSLNIQTIFDSILNADWGEEGVSVSLSIVGVLVALLKQFQKMQVRGRARAIFDLWSDGKNLSGYGSLIEKSFGVQIDPAEMDSLEGYSSAVRSIIRGRATPDQLPA